MELVPCTFQKFRVKSLDTNLVFSMHDPVDCCYMQALFAIWSAKKVAVYVSLDVLLKLKEANVIHQWVVDGLKTSLSKWLILSLFTLWLVLSQQFDASLIGELILFT